MTSEFPIEIGLRLDVLDDEGIWNTGRIVDIGNDEDDMVEIKYDGWGDEYNQWISVSDQRLAPLHMFTIVKKCWAKLTKWPWWPAFVVLRAPTKKSAAESLELEKKIYVEFFDSFQEEKRSRCWMHKKNVVSFTDGFDDRASKTFGKNFPKFVEGTQRALANSSPLLFTENGTLPLEYSTKTPTTYASKKTLYGEEKWPELFKAFSDRYKVLYGYENIPDPAKEFVSFTSSDTDDVVLDDSLRAQKKKRKPSHEEELEVYQDDEESEEKGEEPEAEEEEASEDEDGEGDEDYESSARGRQSSRRRKRKQEATPASRVTRARRVKVIEQLVESSCVSRRTNLPQSNPKRKQNAVPHRDTNMKDENQRGDDLPHFDKPSAILASDKQDIFSSNASGSIAKRHKGDFNAGHLSIATEMHDVLSSQSEFMKPSKLESSAPPSGDVPVPSQPQISSLAQLIKEESTQSAGYLLSTTNRRIIPIRKHPHHRIAPKKLDSSTQPSSTPAYSAINDDPEYYRHWYGGSHTKTGNTPWTIQDWLLQGLKRKLQE